MPNSIEGYVNVVDFGARPNSFLDDTDAFLEALKTGKSIFVPDGIYYISKTLTIENQNLIGCGVLKTHIVSTTTQRDVPILRAGRSCKICDLLLKFEHIDSEASEGERVGIFVQGPTWPLQRASSISNVRIDNTGTCLYASKDGQNGSLGPFSVEHSNLELTNFTFRAIDYGTKESTGNTFSNIFVSNQNYKKDVDCIVKLDGNSTNFSFNHITFFSTLCRNSAISFNNVRGFHLSTCCIMNIGITQNGHGIVEMNNSSGEIGALTFSYLPFESDDLSLIKLYNARTDSETQAVFSSNHLLRIGNLSVEYVNNPSRKKELPERINEGLTGKYKESFKFVSRDKDCVGNYCVEINNYVYATKKDDVETYERFLCDENITFIKKGIVPISGSTAQRPKYRLCKYVSEYFDTDMGKKVCWDGEKWV